MYKKILIPIDGSDASLAVLEKGLELAEIFDAKVHILTVVPEPTILEPYPTYIPVEELVEAAKVRAYAILDKARIKGDSTELDINYEYVTGDSAGSILAYSEEQDIDLIIIGNRGLGAFSRTILGSVSTKVINQSTIPVFVVKNSIKEK